MIVWDCQYNVLLVYLQISSPDYYGTLTIKIGYEKLENGNVTVHLKGNILYCISIASFISTIDQDYYHNAILIMFNIINLIVMTAMDLPAIKRTSLSDPFVSVNMCPRCLFHRKPQDTEVWCDTLNPKFGQHFEL